MTVMLFGVNSIIEKKGSGINLPNLFFYRRERLNSSPPKSFRPSKNEHFVQGRGNRLPPDDY